jgi:two-component system response regulator HupR/HoxA
LRERKEDIAPLVDHFIRKYVARDGREVPGISAEALDLLTAYDFPGNVRELENEIQRALALVGNGRTIMVDALSDKIVRHRPGMNAPEESGAEEEAPQEWTGTLKDRVHSFERSVIVRALDRNSWNRTRTAKQLGISLRPFMEKLKRYGITEKERGK